MPTRAPRPSSPGFPLLPPQRGSRGRGDARSPSRGPMGSPDPPPRGNRRCSLCSAPGPPRLALLPPGVRACCSGNAPRPPGAYEGGSGRTDGAKYERQRGTAAPAHCVARDGDDGRENPLSCGQRDGVNDPPLHRVRLSPTIPRCFRSPSPVRRRRRRRCPPPPRRPLRCRCPSPPCRCDCGSRSAGSGRKSRGRAGPMPRWCRGVGVARGCSGNDRVHWPGRTCRRAVPRSSRATGARRAIPRGSACTSAGSRGR